MKSARYPAARVTPRITLCDECGRYQVPVTSGTIVAFIVRSSKFVCAEQERIGH